MDDAGDRPGSEQAREHGREHGREGGLAFERLIFFSDAVFAIAITLLVLDLKLPPGSHGVVDLYAISDKLFGFALSFWVIGIYWLGHHRLFGRLRADDATVRIMNLVFLASVVFLPFPTSVIAEYPATPSSVAFYAASVAAVGLLLAMLTLVSGRGALLRPDQTLGGTVRLAIYVLGAPIVFTVSIFVAPASPRLAMRLWWLVIPCLMLTALIGRWVGGWIDRRRGQKRRHAS